MTDYLRLAIAEDAAGIIRIVREIPLNKCDDDKNRHCFKIDRTLYSTGSFPTDSNFIPQMRGGGNLRDSLMLGELLLTFPDCVYDAVAIGPFDPVAPAKIFAMPWKISLTAAERNTSTYVDIVQRGIVKRKPNRDSYLS